MPLHAGREADMQACRLLVNIIKIVRCTSVGMKSHFESTHKLYNKAVNAGVPFSLVFKFYPEKKKHCASFSCSYNAVV